MHKIKLNLRNKTDFEIKILVDEKSFTLVPKQTSVVSIPSKVSIEARPVVFGVNSSFILGGLKSDTTIDCTLEKATSGNKYKLALNHAKK